MARNMFNLAPMLEKEKLAANGGNYVDWIRNLRFVLRSAKKEYVLDQPWVMLPERMQHQKKLLLTLLVVMTMIQSSASC